MQLCSAGQLSQISSFFCHLQLPYAPQCLFLSNLSFGSSGFGILGFGLSQSWSLSLFFYLEIWELCLLDVGLSESGSGHSTWTLVSLIFGAWGLRLYLLFIWFAVVTRLTTWYCLFLVACKQKNSLIKGCFHKKQQHQYAKFLLHKKMLVEEESKPNVASLCSGASRRKDRQIIRCRVFILACLASQEVTSRERSCCPRLQRQRPAAEQFEYLSKIGLEKETVVFACPKHS